MTWHDAMARYGSDKPDLRYGLELIDLTEYLAAPSSGCSPAPSRPAGTSARWSCPAAPRRPARSSTAGRTGPRPAAPGAWPTWCWTPRPARPAARWPRTSPAGHLSAGRRRRRQARRRGVLRRRADRREAQELLGAARIEIGRRAGLIDESAWAFCWVVDAPMFEPTDDAGGWTAVHHPFTSPNDGVDGLVRVRAGQSARLRLRHRLQRQRDRRRLASVSTEADVQRRVFELLGISRTRRRTSSASCSRRSSTARRRTAASRSAGTAPACCWPAPTRSAK